MILLDTDVLSSLLRSPPETVVADWLDQQDQALIWTTAVTVFEIRFGLACMAEGRKRAALETEFEALLRGSLAGRVALLDRAAAEAAGVLAARRRMAGRSIDVHDTLIAGIALTRRAVVATRNVKHYQDVETGIVNPWATQGGAS